MSDKELKEILRLHKLWLEGSSIGIRADLRRADLRGANLYRADLWGANLHEADLRRADLRRADLRRADLRGANLYRANLRRADLHEADLRRADLWGADLSSSIGLKSADCSFSGHGESGRRLLAAEINSNVIYFCGCFKGTEANLQQYIDTGKEEYKKSRQKAFDFVKSCMESDEEEHE